MSYCIIETTWRWKKKSKRQLNPVMNPKIRHQLCRDERCLTSSIQHSHISVDSSAHRRLLNYPQCSRTYTWGTQNGILALWLVEASARADWRRGRSSHPFTTSIEHNGPPWIIVKRGIFFFSLGFFRGCFDFRIWETIMI